MKHEINRMSIFAKKAYQHVTEFIIVNVNIKKEPPFRLVVNVNHTIEYLAKQIEAESTIRIIEKHLDSAEPLLDDSMQEDLYVYVYQLYDAGNIAIPFSAHVKNVLKFGDDVFPTTSISDDQSDKLLPPVFLKSAGSSFALTPSGSVHGGQIALEEPCDPLNPINSSIVSDMAPSNVSTVQDRLLAILHNSTALNFFNEFLLQEFSIENSLFWIESQVYKSITDPVVMNECANYLFKTYIQDESPLRLNIEKEMKDAVNRQYRNPNGSIFDELQFFVLAVLSPVYMRYQEESPLFQKFLQFKEEDRYSYVQGRTNWNYDMLWHNQQKRPFWVVIPISQRDNADQVSWKRHQTLLDVLTKYFSAKQSNNLKKYFDDSERGNLGRKIKIRKQKRLVKFFGGVPDTDTIQSQLQIPHESMSLEESIVSDVGGEDMEMDKRRKAGKLVDFFGEAINTKQMKAQNLVGSYSSIKDDPMVLAAVNAVETTDMIGVVNLLSPKEKLALRKKTKKLLSILGKEVVNLNLGKMPLAVTDSNSSVWISSDSSQSVDEVPSSPNPRVAKMEKIANVMGERIPGDLISEVIKETII